MHLWIGKAAGFSLSRRLPALRGQANGRIRAPWWSQRRARPGEAVRFGNVVGIHLNSRLGRGWKPSAAALRVLIPAGRRS
jgi:hypothetical protein